MDGFSEFVWQASVIAFKSLPFLLVFSLVYWLVIVLPRHLQRKHEVELVRAQRAIPESVTHLTQPRVTHNPHYSAPALAAPTDALPDVGRPLALSEWFPRLVDHDGHLFFLGATGSGKNLNTLAVVSARAQQGEKIIIVDVHEKFSDWRGLPAHGVGRNLDDAERAVRAIHAEFLRRFAPNEPVDEGLTVVLDEFPVLGDERKELVPLVLRWFREARIAKMRCIVLSTGWEVEALGVKGQGSIRENFLQVKLGAFAIDALPEAEQLPYPAVLQRGNGRGTPQLIDTTGLPSLIEPQLPRAVVWEPPHSSTPPPLLGANTRRKGVTEEEAAEILRLADEGVAPTRITQLVFGKYSGNLFYKVQKVIDDHKERVKV